MFHKSVKFVDTERPCNSISTPIEMGECMDLCQIQPLKREKNFREQVPVSCLRVKTRMVSKNEKHYTKYCSLYLFNNIWKAILHCGTEGRAHICEESLVIQTLNRDQTYCPITYSWPWKRMENGCRLLYFIIVISLKSLSIKVRTINHSLWSPFYTQKNFIAPGRKMSSNSPAQIQKSHTLSFQVYVAAITLHTVFRKELAV